LAGFGFALCFCFVFGFAARGLTGRCDAAGWELCCGCGAVASFPPVSVLATWTTVRRTIGVPAARARRADLRALAAARRCATRREAALDFGRAAGANGTPTSLTTDGRAGTACGRTIGSLALAQR
jgi:hypothetical protein